MSVDKLIAGNWKMNGDLGLLDLYLEKFSKFSIPENLEIILCPPHPYVKIASNLFENLQIRIGAQDCHHKTDGAFTGDVSSKMLAACGASHVILGHSERRNFYQHENDLIYKKVLNAIESGLIPIICIGETLSELKNNQTLKVLELQLKSVLKDELKNTDFVVAYEPIWAIGTGKIASIEQINHVHKFIRGTIKEIYGIACSKNTRIIYGGSVKDDNSKEILSSPEVNGALIGGASLIPEDFFSILNQVT